MNEVRFCNPPAFDEIGVKALYDKVVKQPMMVQYFPDKLPKGKQMSKSYMYNVWNTIHQDEVNAVIEHANKVRYGVDNKKVKEDFIIITDKWQRQLESMPFVSK